ncbi:hypothetical protein Tco_1271005 [Tanacetum coccineum]
MEACIWLRIDMNMLASKGNVPDVRKVDIYFCNPGGLGKQKKRPLMVKKKKENKKLQRLESYGRYNANLQVKCLMFDNGGEYRLRIPKEEWRGKDTSLVHLKVFSCDSFVKVKDVYGEAMKCTVIGNSSDEIEFSFWDSKVPFSKVEYTVMDSIMEPVYTKSKNDNIVAEHGLRFIKRNLLRAHRNVIHEVQIVELRDRKDHMKISKDEHPFRKLRTLQLPAGKKASQRLWMFMVKEEQDRSKRYKARLMVNGFQQKRGSLHMWEP